jgi:pantoate--beta-alanine ligase
MARRPEVVSSLEAFLSVRASSMFRGAGRGPSGERSVGLVATMGALHPGHISLMSRAAAENDVVVATIFVNPTQFGPNEDLTKYPRTLDKDIDLIVGRGARVDVVFAPSTPAEIYPTGFSTRVDVAAMDNTIEGKARPGHFSGVTTVVSKLFNIIR